MIMGDLVFDTVSHDGVNEKGSKIDIIKALSVSSQRP